MEQLLETGVLLQGLGDEQGYVSVMQQMTPDRYG